MKNRITFAICLLAIIGGVMFAATGGSILPSPICKLGQKGCITPQPQPINITQRMEQLRNRTIRGFIHSNTPPTINDSVVTEAHAQSKQYADAMNAAKAKFPTGKGMKIDTTAYREAISQVQSQFTTYQVTYSLNGTILNYTKMNGTW